MFHKGAGAISASVRHFGWRHVRFQKMKLRLCLSCSTKNSPHVPNIQSVVCEVTISPDRPIPWPGNRQMVERGQHFGTQWQVCHFFKLYSGEWRWCCYHCLLLPLRSLIPYSHNSCFIASDVDQSQSSVVRSIFSYTSLHMPADAWRVWENVWNVTGQGNHAWNASAWEYEWNEMRDRCGMWPLPDDLSTSKWPQLTGEIPAVSKLECHRAWEACLEWWSCNQLWFYF